MLPKTSVRESVGATSQQTEEVQRLVNRVADSEVFRAAPAMRALLLFLWEHHSESLSEYAIAVHALGRRPDFDSKMDATVRVHISRLRNKIREFYAREGATFPLQLSIPLGGHELEWTYSQPQSPTILALSGFRQLPQLYRNVIFGSIFAATILAVFSIVLLVQMHYLKASLPAPAPPLSRFWASFLAGGKPPVIVVPSPVYFRWNNNVVVRDFSISEFSNWSQSSVLRQLAEKWGPPSLYQIYVSALDMEAGLTLQHYLERQGIQPQLTESRNFEIDSATSRNTIFLGVPRTTGYLKQLFEKTNFYYSTFNAPVVVRNRNPKPGEPVEYRQVDYSADHKIYPELIILLPTRPDGGRNLILFGFMPMALVSMLQSRSGLQMLDEQWRKGGSPDSWEMIVQAEMSGETVVKAWPTSIRAIPANFWK